MQRLYAQSCHLNLISRHQAWPLAVPAARLFGFWGLWDDNTAKPESPYARREDEVRERYGCGWRDPYRWMEGMDSEFWRHMEAEQKHTHMTFSGHLRPGFEEMYSELAAIEEGMQSKPGMSHRLGMYEYFNTCKSDTNPHYKRRILGESGDQSVLDVEALANDISGPFQINEVSVSPNHELCAFTLTTEDCHAATHIRKIQTEETIDSLEGVEAFEWYNDSCSLVYTVCSTDLRPDKVLRHILGSRQAADEVLHKEQRGNCHLSLNKTKDNRYIVLSSNSKASSEVYLVDALNPDSRPLLVEERQEGVEYFVEHDRGPLLILTNAGGAVNNKLMMAPASCPQMQNWTCLVPEREGIALEDLHKFEGHVVLLERHGHLPAISILPLHTPQQDRLATLEPEDESMWLTICKGSFKEVPCPHFCPPGMRSFLFPVEGGITGISADSNLAHNASRFTFTATSPLQPDRTLAARLSHLDEGVIFEEAGRQSKPNGAAKANNLVCYQELVRSEDHTLVPMTIVRRAGFPSDSSHKAGQPCLVQLYGAYGISLPVEYTPLQQALLDRGWNLAFLHVRGGGELGRRWHHAGRQQGKLQALQDANACLDAILANGLAAPGYLALHAHSAGGILAGLLLLSRPADFRAAALRMPFLDLFTVMTDSGHPLTEHEWAEWGDPAQPGGSALLQRLCPYLNVGKLTAGTHFPATFITTGSQDQRVPPWMPAKWAASVRHQLGSKCNINIHVTHGSHFLSDEDDLVASAMEATWLVEHMNTD